MGRRWALAVFGALVALGATAAAASGAALAPLGDAQFASDPIYATGPPGDGRLFVVERAGRIDVVDGALKTFLTVPDVATDGERGLLSMAFPADYGTSGLFYVFKVSSADDDQLQVVEYRRSATDPDQADPSSARVVLRQDHNQASNHNGGQLQFGPDGDLYIGFGDGGATPQNGQNLDALLGKVLRIDPRRQPNGDPYGIPATNPFAGDRPCGPGPGTAHCPEIFAYGLRNPFRASFDRVTGDLIVGDVGQNTWEEVDVGRLTDPATRENGLRGANLGWATCEGDFVQGSTTQPCPHALGQTAPFFAYQHSGDPPQTGCAIIGGFVVRDATLTDLAGRYLYGDLCRTDLRTLDLGIRGPDPHPAGLATSTASLISFGEDARGCVYALADHTVYRVAASASGPFACPNPVTPPFAGIGGSASPPPSGGSGPGPTSGTTSSSGVGSSGAGGGSSGGGSSAGGGGGGGGGGDGGGGASTIDTTAPRVRAARAVARRRGAVRIAVSCDEACDLTATGSLRFRGAAASAGLRPAHGHAEAGGRVVLTLRLTRTQRARAQRAKRTLVRIVVTARDAAGNAATTRLRRAYSAA